MAVESLALLSGKLELVLGGLARAITSREGTSAPGAAATDLRKIRKDGECSLVAEGHVDEAVMSQRRHGRNGCAFLTTTLGARRDEQAGVLSPVSSGLPLVSGLVPERLPLCWEVAVSGWDTEEEGVILLELLRVAESGDVLVLGRSVHLGQDLFWKGLRDLVEVASATSLFDARCLSFSQLLDMAPCRVL